MMPPSQSLSLRLPTAMTVIDRFHSIFGENDHARPNVSYRRLSNPSSNAGTGPLALANFRNDVCIKQEFHKSISRHNF
jgi:hypothetical protein